MIPRIMVIKRRVQQRVHFTNNLISTERKNQITDNIRYIIKHLYLYLSDYHLLVTGLGSLIV